MHKMNEIAAKVCAKWCYSHEMLVTLYCASAMIVVPLIPFSICYIKRVREVCYTCYILNALCTIVDTWTQVKRRIIAYLDTINEACEAKGYRL